MKPGRELDQLVIEVVFGLRDRLSKAPTQAEYEAIRRRIDSAPEYSTDILEAWPILEGMNLLNFRQIERRYPKGYEIVSVDDHGHSCGVYASGETMPHAICLAALRAVGYEIKTPVSPG